MKKFKSNLPSKLYIYGLERPMICLSACVIIPDVKTVNIRRKLMNNILLIESVYFLKILIFLII